MSISKDVILSDLLREEIVIRLTKSKYLVSKYILIFDDMSKSLRTELISKLLKINRHLKSKVILSLQYPNDLDLLARMQIDYWILFKKINNKKLKEIYDIIDVENDFISFKNMYNEATEEKYDFFYIDLGKQEFRKNFNMKFIN